MKQIVRPQDLKWYAQSPKKIYHATYIQDISGTVERAGNEEFKSDDYLSAKSIGSEGIYRYGVAQNTINTKPLIDFYVQNVDGHDFNYQIGYRTFRYDIRITMKYNVKVNKEPGEETLIIENLTKYMNMTKKDKKNSRVKFNNIFVYKFGHTDISFGESKEMSHDGHAIGYDVDVKVDDSRTVNIDIKSIINIIHGINSPIFNITVTPSFACQCTIELNTTDESYKTIKKNIKCKSKVPSIIAFAPNTEDQIEVKENKEDEELRIKSEYRSIARFVNWKEVPHQFQIDWNIDDIDTIGNKFLKWAEYIPKIENMLLRTKNFTILEDGTILYHTDKYDGYIAFDSKHDIKGDIFEDLTFSLECNTKILKIHGNVIGEEGDKSIQYDIMIDSYKEEELPDIEIVIRTKDHIKGSIEILSNLPIKCANKIFDYDLNNETWTFISKK